MTEIQNYEQYAVKHNAAYAAFRDIYAAKIPPPVKMQVARESRFVPIAMVVIMTAAAIVSGSHTIITFGGGLIGAAAFVMVEGAIIFYAFFRTRLDMNAERVESVKTLAKGGLTLAFVVAVAGNIHDVLDKAGVELSPLVNIGILVLLAIAAPALAFISGDILALDTLRTSMAVRKAEREYLEALAAWNGAINEAWARERGKWGVKIEVSNSIPELSNGIPLEKQPEIIPSASTLGHSKQPQASSIVRDYFQEHPEAIDGNPIEIAAALGVGKSTVYNVIKSMKESQ